jgi:fatty acid desaturase
MLAYNLFNSAANMYIVWGLAPYVWNSTLGFGVEDNVTVRHFVYLHYLTKYLDFLDTFFMILRHKWDQVHLLQLYHHSTIGIIWKWVYEEAPMVIGATYGFGAAANSFIHSLMYLHYFMAAIGIRNPFKRYMTGMQMIQFIACIAHAAKIGLVYGDSPDAILCVVVQIYYMCSMLALFGYFVYMKPNQRVKRTDNKKKPTPLKIRINGTTYDATEFRKTHPGGNIIDKYDVMIVPDATDAFNNFHTGSKRAMALMRTLPRVDDADDTHQPTTPPGITTTTDFQQMIGSWKSHGLYCGGQLEFTIWATAVAMGVGAGLYLLGQGHPVWGGIVVGFAWGQCGFIQHHSGHLAFSGNPRIDFLIQSLYESLAKGGSGRWWRNRHNKHHAMPNSIEHDGDLRTTPFFAWDDVLIKKVPTSLLRVQHLLFIPMLAIYVPVLSTSVFGFMIRRGYWDELGLCALHFLMVTRFSVNIQHLITFYFLGYSIQGIYFGCMFGLSHYTMPRVETDDKHDWATWQYTTTCNWGVGSRFAEYFSGFLNLQIEHHIATKMPPENYHLIVDDMRAYATHHDLPYVELSFWRAMSNMIGGLRDTGRREYARRIALKRR